MSVLLVEQNARAALALADHGYVMEEGRIVLDGQGRNCGKMRTSRNLPGINTSGERKSYRDVKHYKRRKRWLG